jgi:hypothetical protein
MCFLRCEEAESGMPHSPFRQVVNTLLYALINGCSETLLGYTSQLWLGEGL